jgi:hypothetical protein
MAYELSVAGYTFENPPEEYRKLARLSNNPQPYVNKEASDYYQSDSQDLQFQVEGTLALDPALGGTDDLDELERLQEISISGGEVEVQFDPFFSGKCVIEDDPFRQAEGESTYEFTFTVNSESTDNSAYPARSPPDTGNTFEFGDLDLGYDPDEVSQNYERQTEKVKRLQGIARSVDNDGLIPKVRIGGSIDGEGQAELWQKARDNVQAYLSAEFQKGWALMGSLSIRNNPEAPDYLEGLFTYEMELMIVNDAESGIGEVSSYVDQEVQEAGTYASDSDSGDSSFEDLDFLVLYGSGSLDGSFIEWNSTRITLSDNNTNYVYVDDTDSDGQGKVKVNQSAFPADSVPLYRVEVSGGTIQRVVDVRAILLNDRERQEGGGDGGETIEGDIYFTVFAGDYEIASGTTSSWNDTRLLIASNDLNYVWVEDDNADGSGQVNTSTSGYPSSGNYIEMYRVETDTGSVTDVFDDRPSSLASGRSADADLNLSDGISIDDDLDYERLLTLEDTLGITGVDLLPALGVVKLSENLSMVDVDVEAVGFTSLTENLSVLDGGTATSGGISGDPTLDYSVTLNGGSITATIYQDTSGDGTANKQESVNLQDGTNSTTLTNLDGGSGTAVWIEFDIISGGEETTPDVDSASVDVPSGTGADQNPDTNWRIAPGKYDTSGNEYEGGGVTATYEG